MNSVDIKDIWKSYQLKNKESVPVLKGLSLQVKQGDMVAIMGPSGSGKTTLFNIISGVDRFDRGRVLIDDVELSDMSQDQIALFRRRRLGMVFQDFNLIESLNVKENILLPMILEKSRPGSRRNRRRKSSEFLICRILRGKI